MVSRPARVQLRDFAGRMFTLASGPESWEETRQGGPELLLLGLGPDSPESLPFAREALTAGGGVFWLESPETFKALRKDGGLAPPPPGWTAVDADDALKLSGCRIMFYKPGLRADPDFWGPLLGQLAADAFPPAPGQPLCAWLPGDSTQLLRQELIQALQEAGFSEVLEDAPQDIRGLEKAWQRKRPHFVLSVNFRGLDSEGRVFGLCQALGIPTAIWLVDNPWHLLSGVRLPWWKNANLFVTDASFIPGLRKAGCASARFCPLAAAPHMRASHSGHAGKGLPLFVGRLAFPAQARFFSGARLDPLLEREAGNLLARAMGQADLPDYHWWSARTGQSLWPGAGCRAPGRGADAFSALNRVRWVVEAARHGLKLIGDAGWKKFLPDMAISPPVDYYGALPGEYRNAECVLNVTSLLLPQSLSQRHFDVWTAGGFLLSDATAGLGIFPGDLVEPIRVENPAEYQRKLEVFRSSPGLKRELAEAWRSLVLEKHRYVHRIEAMMEFCGMRLPSNGLKPGRPVSNPA